MFDINLLLQNLRTYRQIYHSEADFQHSFAWELHNQFPGAMIRLEFPWSEKDKQNHLDVLAIIDNVSIAIELKYKTRALSTVKDKESYSLKDQSAQDLGRYDLLKDVMRLEQLTTQINNWIGVAVLLTNDSSYWKKPNNVNTVDSDFRLHQGRIIQGKLNWGNGASLGTIKSRELPIILRNNYKTNWLDYSRPSSGSYWQFRYLAIQV